MPNTQAELNCISYAFYTALFSGVDIRSFTDAESVVDYLCAWAGL